MDLKEHVAVTVRVSAVTIAVNLALTAFKLLAGLLARSSAMVSDAAHSASDVLATLIVLLGVKLAGKAPDAEHPYGHERMECVAALALGLILGGTGLGIGWAGLGKLLGGGALAAPGGLALAAAAVSIAVKEAMCWYTRSAARRITSSALMAEAWHHRSDALSSVGSFAGILGARLGLPALDPAAGVVISLLILKAAWDILRRALGQMTDHACPPETERRMVAAAAAQPGVLGLDTLTTRLFGDRMYVDVEIRADGELTLREAHATAHAVHDALEERFPEVKHCMVHVNPAGEP